ERIPLLLLPDRVIASGFENQSLQAELLLQFLVPLLAQVGRDNDKNLAPSLGPALRDDQTGFNGFAEPHFVSEEHTARKRIAAGEERCIDLMRIQIDLRVDQRCR